MTVLTKDIKCDNITSLRPYDILCGRAKGIFDNIGNRRFRITVGLHFKEYLEEDHDGRRRLIASILHTLHYEAGARFLKPIAENQYVELSESEARKKIGSAFRELNRSSKNEHQKKNSALIPNSNKKCKISQLRRRHERRQKQLSHHDQKDMNMPRSEQRQATVLPKTDLSDASLGTTMDELFGLLDQEIARQQCSANNKDDHSFEKLIPQNLFYPTKKDDEATTANFVW